MGLRRSLGLLVCLCLSVPALADESPQAKLEHFLVQPENHDAVVQVLKLQWNQVVGAACESIKPVNWQVTTYIPVEFGADGKPSKGSWKESVTSEGCGFTKILNVASAVGPDGTVKRLGLLPGSSHADPVLEQDARLQAFAAAGAMLPKDCKPVIITDTAFIAQEGTPSAQVLPGRDPHPWREEWTLKGCGSTAIVTMHFIPDAKGTGFNAATTETRRG
jgi:hypothetical protein